ncbi:MAG: hypothetical protein ACERKO_13015 [Acetanaerobacterium sp.]
MNELFYDNGHITRRALESLAEEAQSDELARLELAEHLSFCDRCLDEYMALLDDSLLLSPPETQVPHIIKRVKRRARVLFFNRYVRVTVAACLAITLWASGVFSIDYMEANSRLIASVGSSVASISQHVNEWKDDLSDELHSLLQPDNMSFFNRKGASPHEKE